MKIISIKFLNLNSLKGEHEIRFDQPPFSESGLFAITGPTGAGKTTILDAITLALYGDVPRHDKNDPSEIMTRHTGESYAEVEFEVKGIIYRSKWSNYRARKKAGNKLQGVKMELSNAVSGEILENNSLARFHSKIIEVCGLDYNQFLRSVILSQGDFTRFLKSSENERSDLLEKITDTTIYSKISVFTFEKTKQERARLDVLNARLNDVMLLPEDEVNAHHENIKELKFKEENTRQTEKALQAKLDWINKIHQLEIRRQSLISALQEEEELYAGNQSHFDKLQHHQRALIYKPALAEIKTAREQVVKNEKNINEQLAQLPATKLVAEEILKTLNVSKSLATKTQNELTEAEPLFAEVIEKDSVIENAKAQLKKTNETFNQTTENFNQTTALLKRVSEKLEAIKNQSFQLTTWLKQHEQDAMLDKELIVFENNTKELNELNSAIREASTKSGQYEEQVAEEKKQLGKNVKDTEAIKTKIENIGEENKGGSEKLQLVLDGKTLDEWENLLNVLPTIINISEQQLKLTDIAIRTRNELQELARQLELNKQLRRSEDEILIRLKKNKEDAGEKLITLQELFELEVRIQKFDAEREQLQPEKPCPLCGAIHHPYAEENHKGHAGEAEQRRNQQRALLEKISQQADEKALLVNTMLNQLTAGDVKFQELQKVLSKAEEEFNNNNLQLPKPLDIEKRDIIVLVIKKKKEEQIALRETIKTIRELQLLISNNETQILKQRELLAQAEGKQDHARINISHAEKQIEMIRVETIVQQEKKNDIKDKLTVMLMRFNVGVDLDDIDNARSMLVTRFDAYTTAINKERELQLQLIQFETEQKNSNESWQEKNKVWADQSIQLKEEQDNLQQLVAERIGLFDTRDPHQERKSLNKILEDARKQIEKLQSEWQQKQEQVNLIEDRILNGNRELKNDRIVLDGYLQSLLETLKENSIDSIDALMLLFIEDDEAMAIDHLQKESMQKIASGKIVLATTENELTVEKAKNLTIENETTLSSQIEAQSLTFSELNQQIGKAMQILEDDGNLKIKHRLLAAEIEIQQKEFQRWDKLSALIGSADGKKFSRFAQGLTLARLTDLANRHLLRLSDRYQIIKTPEKDLELQITDGYQADVVRPMSTLSGGESFLVSLALALGLSDLASRKVQINSLFIDEGFGTLDADTLDIAISALENLQAGGKAIGIISHVEALKDSIGTQIQVTKQPGGYSKISIKGYGQPLMKV